MLLPSIEHQRFGTLTALWPIIRNKYRDTIWQCQCDCGELRMVTAGRLRTNHTKQCRKCALQQIAMKHFRHGHGRSRRNNTPASAEYHAYHNARRRCMEQTNPNYAHYGGRGIEFRFKDFAEFFAEVGSRPSTEHSLDRIDNDGHYEPGNVRWATSEEQVNNRRLKRLDQFSIGELQQELQRRAA